MKFSTLLFFLLTNRIFFSFKLIVDNYKLLTDKMSLEMTEKGLKKKKSIKEYNEIIAQWYLHFCKEKL